LAIGFSTLFACQEYTEPYPFTRISIYFFDSFNGLAQRQRRDWRGAFSIIAQFLAKHAGFERQSRCPTGAGVTIDLKIKIWKTDGENVGGLAQL
jgi:hypothetical protein